MATNAGTERHSSHDEGSEGSSPPDIAPESTSAPEEQVDYLSESFCAHGPVMGDEEKTAITVPGGVCSTYVPRSAQIPPEQQPEYLKKQCQKYRDYIAERDEELKADAEKIEHLEAVIKRKDKEIETFTEENEKLQKKIEDKNKKISEQKDLIAVVKKEGDADRQEFNQQLRVNQQLREELERMESDREKYLAEQEMRRKIADARKSETKLLRDLLKQREESLAQAKRCTEMWKEDFQALCDELKRKEEIIHMQQNVISGFPEALYQGLLFREQENDANTWKKTFVIIKNNSSCRKCALDAHGVPEETLTFSIVAPEVQLTWGRSRSLPNWAILFHPSPQLSKAVIDAYDGGTPLPSIKFSVKRESQTGTPNFQGRFHLKGTALGGVQPCKFFTVSLPTKLKFLT